MADILSIGLTVVSSILAAFGQLGLKFGSMKLKKTFQAVMTNYALLAGVFFYVAASAVFIIALRGGELTILYPIAALNYIWVSLLAKKYFHEELNHYKIIGITLIIIGVALII